MKIVFFTSPLLEDNNPYQHIIDSIKKSLRDKKIEIVHYISIEENKLIKDDELKIFRRRRLKKNNFVMRFIFDNLTHLKMCIFFLKEKNVDMVFEDLSYSSIITIFFSRIKKIKVVLNAQDIWPDNAVLGGFFSEKSFIFKFFNCIQMLVYKYSEVIICISDDMKLHLINKGVNSKKVRVIYNFGYTEKAKSLNYKDSSFIMNNKLYEYKNIVLYAGNIGKIQNLDYLIDAVGEMKVYTLLIIGDGTEKDKFIEMCKNKNYTNIFFYDYLSQNEIMYAYSLASINVVPLQSGAIKTALPSKLPVILSSGGRVLCLFGDGCVFKKDLEDYQIGYCINNDKKEIKKYINKMNMEKKKESNIFEFYDSRFNKKKNCELYVKYIMEEIAK